MPVNQKVASAYIEFVAQTAQFEKALDRAKTVVRETSRQMKQDMHEAQGAIALLGEETGVKMPRHLRTFVAGLPGVATALSFAFNAVAVFALIEVIIKASEKIKEFAHASEEAARKHAEAWRGLSQPMQLANDQLQLSNDKLENAIAKLEHRPENGLKQAIDAAIVSADVLGDKLTADAAKLTQVLKENQPGFFRWIGESFNGSLGIDDLLKRSRDLQSRLEVIEIQAPQMFQGQNDAGIIQQRKALSDQYQKALEDEKKWADDQIKTAKYTETGGPLRYQTGAGSQATRIQALIDYRAALQREGQFNTLSQTNSEDTTKKDKLDAQKLAIEEAKKADAERLKAFEAGLANLKNAHEVSVGEEYLYWSHILETQKFGADTRNAIARVMGQEYQQILRDNAAMDKEAAKLAVIPTVDLSIGSETELKAQTKALTEYIHALNEGQQIRRDAADALAKTTLEMDIQTGAVNRLQAATQLQSMHTAEFARNQALLNEQLAAEKPGTKEYANTQNQLTALNGNRQIQELVDAQAVLSQTWKGMIDSVFDELIRKADDAKGEIRKIAIQTVDSINGELAKLIDGTSKKGDFKKLFQGSSEQLLKTGLQTAEGGILHSLGLGHKKADGYHVFVDNMPGLGQAGVSGAGASGMLAKLFGGDGANGSGTSGQNGNMGASIFAHLGSAVMKVFGGAFGGGFADGGKVYGGVPINVGELGPEKFVPGVPGHIVPNRDLQGGIHLHIDARGTDPAMTEQAVRRAMQQTHAQSVHDSGRALQEMQRRKPR